MRGENKDEPTRSILNVVPTKNDDGASYRCTVWNRALRQEHSLEAGTKIYVNCKYIKIGTYNDRVFHVIRGELFYVGAETHCRL